MCHLVFIFFGCETDHIGAALEPCPTLKRCTILTASFRPLFHQYPQCFFFIIHSFLFDLLPQHFLSIFCVTISSLGSLSSLFLAIHATAFARIGSVHIGGRVLRRQFAYTRPQACLTLQSPCVSPVTVRNRVRSLRLWLNSTTLIISSLVHLLQLDFLEHALQHFQF